MEKNNHALRMQRPTQCHNCGSPRIRFTQNCVLYGRNSGSWPMVWICNDCNASVRCHDGTDIPLGTMADQATRTARAQAHKAFDKLWKDGYYSRGGAYRWLQGVMIMKREDCHISRMTEAQCADVIKLSKERLRELKQEKKGYKFVRGERVKLNRKRRTKHAAHRNKHFAGY